MRTFRCGTTTVRHVSARNSSTAAAKETGTDSRRSGRVVGFAKLGELRPEMQQRICERPQEMSNGNARSCHGTDNYNAAVTLIVL